MKSIHRCALAVAVGLCLTGSALAAGKPLIQSSQPLFSADLASAALAVPADQTVLSGILSSPSTAAVQLARIDASAVDSNQQQIEFDIGGQRLTATQVKTEALEGGNSVWHGNFGSAAVAKAKTLSGMDPLNSAILVRSGDTVTGSIRSNGKLYRVRPLPGGEHAVVEIDENRMPVDHPASDYNRLPTIPMPQTASDRVTAQGIPPGPTATIRVMVVATNQAVASYGGNMQSLMQLAVSESNQSYVNSNVGINLVLANYSTTTYAESSSFNTDLTRFRGTTDGFMDTIHTTRNTSTADVNMLVIHNPTSCGLASAIGSTAATAFAAVHWDCATGNYSFAHEIGHLQSARHDAANDPSTSPYAYGHGYRYEPATGSRWRTIMAYNCGGAGCPRLNYWSNSSVNFGGVPMGNASTADNQRVLVNTKATVAGYR
ncbi:MAG: M12 family metallo-peptidase [Luteimonas sp.]